MSETVVQLAERPRKDGGTRPRKDSGSTRVERPDIKDPIVAAIVNVWLNKAGELGLSISSAAEALGISSSVFHRLTLGKSLKVPYSLVVKYAQLMKEPIQAFIPHINEGADGNQPNVSELEHAASFIAKMQGGDQKRAVAHIRLVVSLVRKARELARTHPNASTYEDAFKSLSIEALITSRTD